MSFRLKIMMHTHSQKLVRFCGGLLIAGLGIQMSGCGLLTDRTNYYVDAKRQAPITVPPGLSQERLQDDYAIPEIESQRPLAAEFVVPPPPEVDAKVLEEQYSIRRSDEQVWLLVGEEPGRVWPALARFWNEQGLEVVDSLAKEGLVLTSASGSSARSHSFLESLGLNADQGHRFQVKLDQGLKRGTSEVSVRLLPAESGRASLAELWQQASQDPDREQQVLELLMSYLQSEEAERSYSLVAQDISTGAKVFLQTEAAEPFIRLDLSFERAWNALDKALQDAQVRVVDLNRSERVYLVSYEQDDESSSWWPSWLSFKSKQTPSDRYNYRVVLQQTADGIRVKAEGTEADSSREQEIRLLTRIYENIT